MSDLRFDWLMTSLAMWFLLGAYVDAWAHRHIGDLETFFTPWHAIFYSGFFATTFALVARAWVARTKGASWSEALPRAYRLSVVGAMVFLIGGIGDMLWHLAFGIEKATSALLSPTHLMLACGAAIMASGPIRAAWSRWQGRVPNNFADVGPAIVSAAGIIAVLAFITQFASPFASEWAAATRDPHASVGIPAPGDFRGLYAVLELDQGLTSILIQSALFMGVVLYILRNRLLLPGSMTVITTITVSLMALMAGADSLETGPLAVIITATIAGILADILLVRLRPAPERLFALRIFAFAVPVLVYGSNLILLQVLGGIWWSVHVAVGIIVLAGVAGWLESFLLVPRVEH